MSGQAFLKSKETVREVNVFLESWFGRFSAELRDTANKCPPDERAGILRELDNLSDVAQHARRALVVGEIAMDANCGWEKFRRTFNPLPAPKDHTHQAWTQGTNSSGGQLFDRLSAELHDTLEKCPPDERTWILGELDNLFTLYGMLGERLQSVRSLLTRIVVWRS
jgi:hypothetical protein